ncbi:hypothetical protein CAP48_18280 [Advenella sp. S44]|uniref:CoA transferase n=1 Tax=Advenella sp. S44 TaxID=1982755 RepID=UPI000C2A7AB9|nr:CoA transferase [Advenella sp. S44]PJX20356.1 hypothetical protein CAP48_18280 [Advenella sp. S44]
MAETILENLGVNWRPGTVPQDWTELGASVSRQAALLGMQEANLVDNPADALCSLHHPKAGAVHVGLGDDIGSGSPHITESTLQAVCGLMSVHGRASGGPQPLGLPYLSVLTGAVTLQSGLAGLLGQMNGGAFEKVEVSALACGLLSVSQYLAGASAQEDPEQIAPGSTDPVLRPPFTSADGVVFEIETLDSAPWRRFWEILGLDPETAGRAWTAFLLRYAKAIAPIPGVCLQLLSEVPYSRISEAAGKAGLALVPVRTLDQRRKDPDYARDAVSPWKISCDSGLPYLRHGVRPNELPLQGIRVIESCRRIQGPLAGHMLAMLGAEVIRLEPPGGDPLRAMPPVANGCSVRFDALNHLKQVRQVDIKSEAGRRQVYEYVRESDVFLHNWAPGKAAQLRLDAQNMHAIRPDLVYSYAGGWGDANIAAPGTDFTVQAWSGVASAIAASNGIRGGSLFTVLDVLGGVVASLGTTAALLRRASTGLGCSVESSLLGAADLLMQSASLSQAKGGFSKVLPTRDGMLAIECTTEGHRQALDRILGMTCSGQATQAQQISLASDLSDIWVSRLRLEGIPCSPVVSNLADMATHGQLARHLNHKSYSSVNCPWSFS